MDNFKILQQNLDSTAKIIGSYCDVQEKQIALYKDVLKQIQTVLINETNCEIAIDKILEIFGTDGLEESLKGE